MTLHSLSYNHPASNLHTINQNNQPNAQQQQQTQALQHLQATRTSNSNLPSSKIDISTKMSSSTASYPSNGYMSHEEHESSPEAFSLFDYARSMHEHTKKQMEAADKSARRRSANSMGSNTHATLRTGHDATTSMDSSSSSSSSGSR